MLFIIKYISYFTIVLQVRTKLPSYNFLYNILKFYCLLEFFFFFLFPVSIWIFCLSRPSWTAKIISSMDLLMKTVEGRTTSRRLIRESIRNWLSDLARSEMEEMAVPVAQFPIFRVVRILGVISAVLVLTWTVRYRGGLALVSDNKDLIFNVIVSFKP